MECINPDACLQGDEDNMLQSCEKGYQGPLCSQCTGNFYISGASHICYDCYAEDMKVRFISLSLFMVLVFGALITFVVLANSLVEIRPLNYLPAGIKLVSMYFQLIFVFYRIQTKSLAE